MKLLEIGTVQNARQPITAFYNNLFSAKNRCKLTYLFNLNAWLTMVYYDIVQVINILTLF